MGKINWIKAKKFITKAFGQVRERKRGKVQFAIECVINIHCRGHKLSANCYVCSAQNCATSVLFKLADFEFLELHMSRFHGKGECFIIRNWNYWAGDKTSRLVKLIRVVLSAKSASHSCIKNKRKCFTQHRAHTRSGCFIHKTSNLLKIHSQPQGPRSLFASTHILCFFFCSWIFRSRESKNYYERSRKFEVIFQSSNSTRISFVWFDNRRWGNKLKLKTQFRAIPT